MVKKCNNGAYIPLAPNTFLLRGPSHKNGGVDISPNIEAEGGEVIQIGNGRIRILSKHKLGAGKSPANNFLRGMDFNTAFNLQENYKDRNRLNDDGSKYKTGGENEIELTKLTPEEERIFQMWYKGMATRSGMSLNPDDKEHYYDYRGYWKNISKDKHIWDNKGHFYDTYKLPGHPTFSDQSNYAKGKYASKYASLAGHWVNGLEYNRITGSTQKEDEVYLNPKDYNDYMTKYKSQIKKFGGEDDIIDKIKHKIIATKNKLFGRVKVDVPKIENGYDFSKIIATDNRPFNADSINYIASKLNNLDNNFQRAAVIANIIDESGGDPYAASKDNTYRGLLQWADDRWSEIEKAGDIPTMDEQLAYFTKTIDNLTDGKTWTHGGKGSGYQSNKDAYNAFKKGENIDTVMHGFTWGNVRPLGKQASYENRLKIAKQVLDVLNSKQEKALGGMANHFIYNIGGKDRLAILPSTGSKIEARCGGKFSSKKSKSGKHKALFGLDDIGTANLIGNGISALANIGSGLITDAGINKLQAPTRQIVTPERALKLNTTYNIGSQLETMNSTLANMGNALKNNTASSQGYAARLNRYGSVRDQLSRQLFEDKNNRESQLINTDLQNQQNVMNRNIVRSDEAANRYNEASREFNNDRIKLKAANWASTIDKVSGDISGGIHAFIGSDQRKKQAELDNNNLLVTMLPYLDNIPGIKDDKALQDSIMEKIKKILGTIQ